MARTRIEKTAEEFVTIYNSAATLGDALKDLGLKDSPEMQKYVRQKASMMRRKYSIPLKKFPSTGRGVSVDWDIVRKAAKKAMPKE